MQMGPLAVAGMPVESTTGSSVHPGFTDILLGLTEGDFVGAATEDLQSEMCQFK